MKVLILSTYATAGGAAIAASRLKEALQKNGVETSMAVSCKGWIRGKTWAFVKERLAILLANRGRRDNLYAIDIALTGEDVTKLKEYKEADVIHLHWVNQGFLSFNILQKIVNSGKRIVWTMHDAWTTTGICHLTLGCEAYQAQCGNCKYLTHPHPNDLSHTVWEKKRRLYARHNITFVTCSRWLKAEALKSSLLAQQDVRCVPNPIDTARYAPHDKTACRDALHLPTDKKLLLFVAQSVNNPNKGMTYLADAIQRIRDNSIALVMLGGRDNGIKDLIPDTEVYALGYIRDAETICKVYSAADAFVLPSLSENLPNTIMEAMSCGTPCVGFDIGGIPEMIDHKQNGYVARYRDTADLAQGLIDTLNNNAAYSTHCREKVVREYSENAVAEKYINIYSMYNV